MTGFVRQLYKSILPYETRLQIQKLTHSKGFRNLRSVVHPSAKGDFSLKAYDENKCIFVHITKTAGTSVARSLFDYLPYHYTAIDYRVIYGKKTFNNYYKFAFVRNPWDRLYSAYRYLKSGGWNEDDKKWANDNLAEHHNFSSFIKHWLTPENINRHLHFIPQYQFICDPKGRILIDYLAYFETINSDFKHIADHLAINKKIGHYNANTKDSYRDAYDTEMREIVAEVYAKDISLFGYNFDGIIHRRIL